MSELKSCPFCGGEADMVRPGTHRQSCIVECRNCGCRLESSEEGELSGVSWNTRADDAALSRLRDTQRVLVEALREVSEWFALTKPPLDQWEDLAEEFHKETGFLRPGKSYPMGYGLDEEREAERDAKWKEWAEKRRADMTARIRAALASVEQPQPSKTPFRLDPTPVYDQHYAATQSEVEQPVHSVKGPDHG